MSHRNRRSNLQSSRRCVIYSTMEADADKHSADRHYADAYYPSLLAEDVANGLLPSRRHRQPPYNVLWTPPDKEVEQLVARAIARPEDDYAGWHAYLSDSLEDFVHDCAHTVMLYEKAIYEIVYWSDPETDRAVEFQLRLITSGSVKWMNGKPFQHLPQSVARRCDVESPIELNSADLLIVVPPQYVRDSFSQMLETIARADAMKRIMSALHQSETSPRATLNPSELRHSEFLTVARATREIGWNARGLIEEYFDTFYLVERQIRFEKFRAQLRASILSALNEGLACAGRRIGFSGQITLEGISSFADIEQIETKFFSGEVSAQEVIAAFQ